MVQNFPNQFKLIDLSENTGKEVLLSIPSDVLGSNLRFQSWCKSSLKPNKDQRHTVNSKPIIECGHRVNALIAGNQKLYGLLGITPDFWRGMELNISNSLFAVIGADFVEKVSVCFHISLNPIG